MNISLSISLALLALIYPPASVSASPNDKARTGKLTSNNSLAEGLLEQYMKELEELPEQQEDESEIIKKFASQSVATKPASDSSVEQSTNTAATVYSFNPDMSCFTNSDFTKSAPAKSAPGKASSLAFSEKEPSNVYDSPSGSKSRKSASKSQLKITENHAEPSFKIKSSVPLVDDSLFTVIEDDNLSESDDSESELPLPILALLLGEKQSQGIVHASDTSSDVEKIVPVLEPTESQCPKDMQPDFESQGQKIESISVVQPESESQDQKTGPIPALQPESESQNQKTEPVPDKSIAIDQRPVISRVASENSRSFGIVVENDNMPQTPRKMQFNRLNLEKLDFTPLWALLVIYLLSLLISL